MNYYKEHAKEYVIKTKDIDMTSSYEFFLKYAKPKSRLLDIGFGSGRDSIYFKNKGYNVTSIDSTLEFCQIAKGLGLDDIRCMKAEEIDYIEEFECIWACASLLHVHSNDLNKVFINCNNALKNDGIMYCSFRYGNFEGTIDDRYFIYLTEDSINEYLIDTNLKIIDYKITDDNLKRDIKWINFILKKTN